MKNIPVDHPMSYEQGVGCLLKEVESAARAIVEIHLDASHLNNESKAYKEALERFHRANMAVFRWKDAWYEIAKVTDERNPL